ncbi:uncharacterized protein LOC133777795 [Humulus lupulus]|uniref:uncharacterized protein LOC133777795 n=1 Tax=Humulus lupulus TaxID=3486 RepID=UPI002B40996A|nr:uncharacterized protein LOC133777795 [Humulus lupulus]
MSLGIGDVKIRVENKIKIPRSYSSLYTPAKKISSRLLHSASNPNCSDSPSPTPVTQLHDLIISAPFGINSHCNLSRIASFFFKFRHPRQSHGFGHNKRPIAKCHTAARPVILEPVMLANL